jgi:ribosomal protein L37AE/L43A
MNKPSAHEVPQCSNCQAQSWVRAGSRPSQCRRIAIATTNEPFTFEDTAPATDLLGLTKVWECGVCSSRLSARESALMDALRRRILATQ